MRIFVLRSTQTNNNKCPKSKHKAKQRLQVKKFQMERIWCILVSHHRTYRQAFKTADQCFKVRKQEHLCFPLELFFTSESETKIMVLEMERHHSISDPNRMFTTEKEDTPLRNLP